MKGYKITYNVPDGWQGVELTTSVPSPAALLQFAIDNLPKGVEIVSVEEMKGEKIANL